MPPHNLGTVTVKLGDALNHWDETRGRELEGQPIRLDVDPSQIGYAHLADYFGPWAIQTGLGLALAKKWERLDLAAHVRLQQATIPGDGQITDAGYTLHPGGVAEIFLSGTLMKRSSSLSSSSSTIQTRRRIRAALADEAVQGILLRIDSPGGTVAGTRELAEDVAAASRKKRVHAFLEDLGASAAYYIASQAARVSVNEAGLVGSIGTFLVIEDTSKLAEDLGIRVHVVRAGEFKGLGTPGTEVTEAHLAYLQDLVNKQNELFLNAVAAGRGMKPADVRKLADGRLHVAADARALRLVDAVESFEEALAAFGGPNRNRRSAATPAANQTEEDVMTRQNETNSAHPDAVNITIAGGVPVPTSPEQPTQAKTEQPAAAGAAEPPAAQPASYAELVAACEGIDKADARDQAFLVQQLDAQATQTQARSAWIAELKERASSAPRKRPGVEPVGQSASAKPDAGADPLDAFDEAVQELVDKGVPRHQAHQRVCQERPDLREAYVAAWNEKHRR